MMSQCDLHHENEIISNKTVFSSHCIWVIFLWWKCLLWAHVIRQKSSSFDNLLFDVMISQSQCEHAIRRSAPVRQTDKFIHHISYTRKVPLMLLCRTNTESRAQSRRSLCITCQQTWTQHSYRLTFHQLDAAGRRSVTWGSYEVSVFLLPVLPPPLLHL